MYNLWIDWRYCSALLDLKAKLRGHWIDPPECLFVDHPLFPTLISVDMTSQQNKVQRRNQVKKSGWRSMGPDMTECGFNGIRGCDCEIDQGASVLFQRTL